MNDPADNAHLVVFAEKGCRVMAIRSDKSSAGLRGAKGAVAPGIHIERGTHMEREGTIQAPGLYKPKSGAGQQNWS
jgi:hypothetical protein